MKTLDLLIRKSSITNVLISFLLFGIILIAGCSSSTVKSTTQDKNITTIKSVLEKQFTGPDLKLVKLYESDKNLTVVGTDGKVTQPKSPTKLDKYYEKMYQGYFTENMYNKFITAYAFNYQYLAHNNGYKIKAGDIEIKEDRKTNASYEFKVNVLYEKDGEKQKSAVVSGRVNFSKDGKISYIRYLENSELTKGLGR